MKKLLINGSQSDNGKTQKALGEYVLLILFLLLGATAKADIEVKSPSGALTLTIGVKDKKPFYRVTKGSYEVISNSTLGVKYGDTSLFSFDTAVSDKSETIDETYQLGHGKRSTYINKCNEQTVTFKNSGNQNQLTMVFRVYNDAVAFRYTKTDGTGTFVYDDEQTEFAVGSFKRCWVMEEYKPSYEARFTGYSADDLETTFYQDTEYGYCMPMLIQTGQDDAWCLVTESANLSSIAASSLIYNDEKGSLGLKLMKHGNKVGNGPTESRFTVPFQSPWRTIIIGSLAQIVESNVTQNLSPKSVIGDDSWVKPGRVAWNWAAEDGSQQLNSAMCRRYTDMAAYFGWEYNLLDEGWDGKLNVKEEIEYARQKGVGLILWFNQDHFKGDAKAIYDDLKQYADMGVKGFKIDFFEDDRQEQLAKYERILDAAQKLHLLINFHGCTKPSGLDRTWPNLLSMEGVFGNEQYMCYSDWTPAYHIVNLCLTRNVIGSMDFTPLKWGMSNNSIRSIANNTWGQQLAMCVAFESGLFHSCDTPENLTYSVAVPLLKRLPVTWDDIRCLEARPDEYATIARRKAGEWWVATLANSQRTASIKTDFLEEGKTYYAHIYRDGDYSYEVKSEVRKGVTKGQTIEIPVLKYGGAIVVFTTDATIGFAHDRTYEAEHYNQGGTIERDPRLFGGKYVSSLGGARRLVFTDVMAQEAGQYAVTLYYRADSPTKVYVETADGTKTRLSLQQPGVRENDQPGENIGFRTALVNLKQGLNTLIVGNDEEGQAPMIDHISVRPTAFPVARDNEYLTADGQSLENTIEGKKESDHFTVNAEKEGIYDLTFFYTASETCDLTVETDGKTVTLSCPASGAAVKRVTASCHLKAGANTITLGHTEGKTISINKLQAGFVCDGKTPSSVIAARTATPGAAAIYDLQGRQVSKPEKGIYIVNGKKIATRKR